MTEPLDLSLPRKKDGTYPFFVWSASLVLAPLLLFIWMLVRNQLGPADGIFIFLFLFVIYGALFSVPALVFYYAGYLLISRLNIQVVYLKALSALVGLVCMLVTLYLFDLIVLAYVYAPGILIPSMIFNWNKKGER